MANSRARNKPSDEHLKALAKGRSESAMVRRYLVALESHKPRRGRKRTPDSMKRRLNAIETELRSADPLTRLGLIQERIDLQAQLDAESSGVDMKALEEEFIRAAKTYGERKGITYAAWRELGVDPALLRKAGISRANS